MGKIRKIFRFQTISQAYSSSFFWRCCCVKWSTHEKYFPKESSRLLFSDLGRLLPYFLKKNPRVLLNFQNWIQGSWICGQWLSSEERGVVKLKSGWQLRLTVLPKKVAADVIFFSSYVTTIQWRIDLHTFDFSTHLYIIATPFRSKTEIQFRFEKWTLKSHEISQRLSCHIFHKFALEKK